MFVMVSLKILSNYMYFQANSELNFDKAGTDSTAASTEEAVKKS